MLSHLKILETTADEVFHLSNTKTNKGKEVIEFHSGLRISKSINYFGEVYTNELKHLDSWMNVYNALDVSPLKIYMINYS